jgi:hypothetical protein
MTVAPKSCQRPDVLEHDRDTIGRVGHGGGEAGINEKGERDDRSAPRERVHDTGHEPAAHDQYE